MARKKNNEVVNTAPAEVAVQPEGVEVVVNGITYIDTFKDGCTFRNRKES